MEWPWLAILGVVVGMITIRVSVTPIINRLLDIRNEKRIVELQSICPHIEIVYGDRGLEVISTIEGVPRSMSAMCRMCTVVVPKGGESTERMFKRDAEYFVEHPKEYRKAMDNVRKLRKKIQWSKHTAILM